MNVLDSLKVSIVPLAAGVALFGTNFTPDHKVVMAPDAAREPQSLVTDVKPNAPTPTADPPPLASPTPTAATQTARTQVTLAPPSSPARSPLTQSARPAPVPTQLAPRTSASPSTPRSVATRSHPSAPAPGGAPTNPVAPAVTNQGAARLPDLVTFAPLPADAPTLIAQVPQDSVGSDVPTAPATPTPTAPPPASARTNHAVNAANPANPANPANAANPATTQVTVFTIDNQCNDFRQTQITVPADKAMETAIGKVLADRENGDFSLGGYRIRVNGGVATVDLRPAPHSERSLHSLTHCEQLALFGGVRRTLLGNAQWRIQDVQFTIAGEELYF